MHTPGPWKIETLDTPVYGSDGALVATGVGIGTQSEHIVTVTGRSSTRAANAALIAAAPELKVRLQELTESVRQLIAMQRESGNIHAALGWYEALAEKAKAAIAKAEGLA